MTVDLQHRLVRQAINIAVSKAMDDMRSDAKRSIRNLVDLGLLFSKSENQKQFFGIAQEVISNPKNAYHSLTARAIADVNNDTIKKVGLNLGYSSLIYGANKLRKRQEFFDDLLPWLLIFDISDFSAESSNQMRRFIAEGGNWAFIAISCAHTKQKISSQYVKSQNVLTSAFCPGRTLRVNLRALCRGYWRYTQYDGFCKGVRFKFMH